MLVRLALETDEDVFVELARQGAQESLAYLGFSETRVRETFQEYLATANPTIFLADHHFDVVGFLIATMRLYRHVDALFTTQEVLFVRPDKRGSRAASALVSELVRWSDRLGAREILGGNDNNFNSEKTARLLEKFGFERVGIFLRRVGSADSGWRR